MVSSTENKTDLIFKKMLDNLKSSVLECILKQQSTRLANIKSAPLKKTLYNEL